MDNCEISFFSENTNFVFRGKRKTALWICSTIKEERSLAGEISCIFCDDNYLSNLNTTYLKKSTLTDIIAFDYCANGVINGDLFISIDRIKENAKLFNVKMYSELHRVIIHGVLHLLGYKDRYEEDKKLMRTKEEYYLEKLKNAI